LDKREVNVGHANKALEVSTALQDMQEYSREGYYINWDEAEKIIAAAIAESKGDALEQAAKIIDEERERVLNCQKKGAVPAGR